MGYGPLVRASTGVTRLWTSCDAEPGTFYDATTIFPDHVVGRLTAIATLAVLIRRGRTGVGGHVHISQAEAAINQLTEVYVAESARAAGLPVDERRGDPCGVPVRRRRRVVRHLAAGRTGPGDGRRADRGRRATR